MMRRFIIIVCGSVVFSLLHIENACLNFIGMMIGMLIIQIPLEIIHAREIRENEKYKKWRSY